MTIHSALSQFLGLATSIMIIRLSILAVLLVASAVDAFSSTIPNRQLCSLAHQPASPFLSTSVGKPSRASMLLASSDDDDNVVEVASSDQLLLGVGGTIASLIMFYSEYTLSTTGCGLPAGPFGLVGLLEGLSYLCVTGIVVFSVVTKVRTVRKHKNFACLYLTVMTQNNIVLFDFNPQGSGLPAGPFGLVGAAEGLSFLALLVGVVVLGLQVTNYGYIPNAVPMEGGMCS